MGQYSIRVNDPFRVCFRWSKAGAKDVEIVDAQKAGAAIPAPKGRVSFGVE